VAAITLQVGDRVCRQKRGGLLPIAGGAFKNRYGTYEQFNSPAKTKMDYFPGGALLKQGTGKTNLVFDVSESSERCACHSGWHKSHIQQVIVKT
jgi:hypothetical protein